MATKIQQILAKVISYIPTIKNGGMRLVYGMALIYGLLIFLYVLGWLWNWKETGKADLASMAALITILLGPSAIAAFTALGRGMTDEDEDGTPDAFEEKLDGDDKK